MTFSSLVMKNLIRSRRRTALTVLSVGIAVFLFVALKTVLTSFEDTVEAGEDTRLVTRHATSLTFLLPLSHLSKIRQVEGVTDVTYSNWFQGIYIDEKNFFARFAADIPGYLRIYPEMVVPEDQVKAVLADRSGCILGRATAEKFKLKIGDRMTLKGDIYPGEYNFTVRGIYRSTKPNFDETVLFFHWDYLNDMLSENEKGEVGAYVVQIDDPSRTAEISAAIDAQFANSPAETKTETERAFNAGFINMMGNVTFLLMSISGAIVLSIVMVAANTMAMSIRERTSEIGLLKVLGFPVRAIFGIIMAESMLLSLGGGLLGAGLARVSLHGATFGGFLPFFLIRPMTLAQGFAIALAIGLVAGFFPALHAARSSSQEALKTIG